MEKMFNIEDSIALQNKIAEITSINVEEKYNIENNVLEGYFIVSGTYKQKGISFNQDNFNFKIPFECNVEEYDNDSVRIEIDDFSYSFNDNEINVNIDYYLIADIRELLDEEPLLDLEPSIPPIKEISNEQVKTNKINDLPDTYVTYVIYTVNKNDSLVSIANNFKINIDDIKEYNDITELKEGIKLVIPYHE